MHSLPSKINKFYERVLSFMVYRCGTLLPDRLFICARFRLIYHYPLNLKNPKTFNEKLQWLKLYDQNPLYHQLADKYDVRAYVACKVGKEHLIPSLGVWNSTDEIPFDALPNQFVLKCTHDSQSVFLCKDKGTFDKNRVYKALNDGLATNYFRFGREWAYKNITPKITAEAFITDESGYDLKDYKVFCFNGEPRFIQVDYDRFIHHKRRLFTTSWTPMTDVSITYPDDSNIEIAKPWCLEQMLELSHVLSKDIPFLRVDWYVTKEKLLFGELTFYPGGGYEPITPFSYDVKWGEWLTI